MLAQVCPHNILPSPSICMSRSLPARVCSELSEPALSQSEAEEKEAFARDKKAVNLIKVRGEGPRWAELVCVGQGLWSRGET